MSTQPLERSHHEPVTLAPRSPVVLIAEDDPVMRRLLKIVLELAGFHVLDVMDGAELEQWIERLIEHAHDHRCVDLIIADQRLPTITGLEALAHLRHVDWSTPFILLTAFSDTATHVEAKRLGASYVLDKPFDLDELRAAALQFAMPGEA